MAGHNKWSKIKRKKGVTDARRSKKFTKLIKEMTVAAKIGGPDIDANPRLRLAVQNAKGINMPKDNIDRAIKKAAGGESANYQDVTYEGYGAGSVAVFVECSTDNLNRTIQDVRLAFSKSGGSLATRGTFDFIFDQKGVFEFTLPESISEDDLTLELIDAGAEEVENDENFITVTCAREDFGTVQKKMDELKIEPESANLVRIPKVFKEISGDDLLKMKKLIDMLEESDDVQNVYHNLEPTDEVLEILE